MCVFQCNVDDLVEGILGNINFAYLFIDLWMKFVEMYGKHSVESYHLEHFHESVIASGRAAGRIPFPSIETLNGQNGEEEFDKWKSVIVISQPLAKITQFGYHLRRFLQIFDVNVFDLEAFGLIDAAESDYCPSQNISEHATTTRITRGDAIRVLVFFFSTFEIFS